MSRRSDLLSDAQWEKIGPLLPDLKSRGRPWRSNREVLEGLLWVLRSGACWHDLPNIRVPQRVGVACVAGKRMGRGCVSGAPS